MAHPPANGSAPPEQKGEHRASEPAQRPLVPERRGSGFLNFFSSILASKNLVPHAADPSKNTAWLFDNTAFLSVDDESDGSSQPSWKTEAVTCVFRTEGRKDVGKWVAAIADYIGLDGEIGHDDDGAEIGRSIIEKRVQPFLDQVSPSCTVKIDLKVDGSAQSHSLGPSNRNGIISQTVDLGGSYVHDGALVCSSIRGFTSQPAATAETRFAAPEGWLVISDIDDTIKRTMTMEPTGILRTTFAQEPVAIKNMPDFYRHIQSELDPTWFYLSASPYNLYPFLHQFLHENYCPGTLVLRDYSWLDISGLIRSFTENTLEYKVDRMEKIRSWFPRRRVLCIGDSTQKDPEAYAEMYHRYPEWIHAIIIRKVTDVSNMEEKNKPERFETAFKDIPPEAWTVFEDTQELYDFVDGLGMENLAL